jgi:integrase
MATGHVRKRGSTWSFVHYIDDPATGEGRHRWKGGFATKKEAERALRDALAAVDGGSWIEPTKLKFREYVERIWLPHMEDQIEDSTWESYERYMRLHVLPHVGNSKLQKLQPAQLNDLYRLLLRQEVETPTATNRKHPTKVYERIFELRHAGRSFGQIANTIKDEFPTESDITRHAVSRIVARAREAEPTTKKNLSITTVRYIHTIISRSLRDATKLGYVTVNVAASASPPRKSKARKEKVLWTADQTREFLEWCQTQKHRLWPAFAFIATSGDRRGANLGLHWADIDFEDGTAKLITTVTAVRHQIVVKPYGKTGALHQIIIDGGTLVILKWWRAQQAKERLSVGSVHTCESDQAGCGIDGYHDRDLVFSRPDGDYLHPERFSREFDRAQARYNRDHIESPLPKINLHALRHGWATLALEAGVPMKVVQDRLNHSSESVTADIYTHVRAPLQSDAAERVAAMILPTGTYSDS